MKIEIVRPVVYFHDPIDSKGVIRSKLKTITFKLGELFSGPGGIALGATTASIADSRGKVYTIAHQWANDYDKKTGEKRTSLQVVTMRVQVLSQNEHADGESQPAKGAPSQETVDSMDNVPF